MSTKDLKTLPKTSIKVWTPLIKKLDAQMKNACLRRDAYLSKVLEIELEALDAEVSIPNSQASYDYVIDRLNQLPRWLVSLALPSKLTEHLNDICRRKRIVRDAFFNRLFFYSLSHPKLSTPCCLQTLVGNGAARSGARIRTKAHSSRTLFVRCNQSSIHFGQFEAGLKYSPKTKN